MNTKKKLTRWIALSLALFLFFSVASPSLAFASDEVETMRLAGKNRYETAIAISQAGWTESEYVILARGDDFPDALCAAPLAAAYDAPILLTSKSALHDGVKEELKRLGAVRVFLMGGESALSEGIVEELKEMGIEEVIRISGKNRYETSVKVAEMLEEKLTIDEIVLATGLNYADALSMAAVAAKLGMPILLVGKNGMDDSVREYIESREVSRTYIIGGEGVISPELEAGVPNPVRLWGKNRYETNIEIMTYFQDQLDLSRVFVAVGDGPKKNEFADALSGAALAARTASPVLLISRILPGVTKDFLTNNYPLVGTLMILGGASVVSEQVVEEMVAAASGQVDIPGDTEEEEPPEDDEDGSGDSGGIGGGGIPVEEPDTPASIISASAKIGGQYYSAVKVGENEFTFTLPTGLDEENTKVTEIRITATSDAYSLTVIGFVTKTVYFSNGTVNVMVSDLLGSLDEEGDGIAIATLRAFLQTFGLTAEGILIDKEGNETIVRLRFTNE